MTAIDSVGYVAAGLVLATFCARTMLSLRSLAIASNFAFISYGFSAHLWPILLLHAVMLPLNVTRWRAARGSAAPAARPSDTGRPAMSITLRPIDRQRRIVPAPALPMRREIAGHRRAFCATRRNPMMAAAEAPPRGGASDRGWGERAIACGSSMQS